MNDMPDCSTTTTPTARKDHKCTSCGVCIKKGTAYTKISGIWNGDAEEYKLCENCKAVIFDFQKMDENLDCYDGPSLCKGGVSEWLQGFICCGWSGEKADRDMAKLFDLDIDYIKRMLGINPNNGEDYERKRRNYRGDRG